MSKSIPAFSLILIGGWAVAAAFRPMVGPFEQGWPILVGLLGLTALTQSQAQPGLIFVGVMLLLGGLFFSLFTLFGLSWSVFSLWWPLLLILVGAAFMVVYLTMDMQSPELLVPTFVFGGIGLLALLVTLGITRQSTFAQALRLWPLGILFLVLTVMTHADRD